MRPTLVVILALLAFGALGLAAGGGPYQLRRAVLDLVGDKLDWQARSLAGSHAVNCGRVDAGHDASGANDCVRASLASGKAFRVRYGVQSIDSEIDTGIVLSPQGRLYAITVFYRGSLLQQRVHLQDCKAELQVASGGRLVCLPSPGF